MKKRLSILFSLVAVLVLNSCKGVVGDGVLGPDVSLTLKNGTVANFYLVGPKSFNFGYGEGSIRDVYAYKTSEKVSPDNLNSDYIKSNIKVTFKGENIKIEDVIVSDTYYEKGYFNISEKIVGKGVEIRGDFLPDYFKIKVPESFKDTGIAQTWIKKYSISLIIPPETKK